MGKQKNAQLCWAEELVTQSRATRQRLLTRKLRRDDYVFPDAVALTAIVWQDCLPRVIDVDQRWLSAMLTDVRRTSNTVKAVEDCFVQIINEQRPMTLRSFKRSCVFAGASVELIGQYLKPIEAEVSDCICSRQFFGLCSVYQALAFLGRMNMKNQSDLLEQAKTDWLQFDSSIRSHGDPLDINSLLKQWFPRRVIPRVYGGFEPKHGSGSVSEFGPIGLYLKYQQMTLTQRATFIMRQVQRYGGVALFPPLGEELPAQWHAVPKSAVKYRSICMEPIGNQFVQQGFFYSLGRYIGSHPYLRHHIDLTDQSLNRDVAWLGSIDGSLATLDLSNASDAIGYDDIRNWTYGTALYEIAICCRSRKALVDGDVVELKKVSSMGSSLTFLYESIIFLAVVVRGMQSAGATSEIMSRDVRAYGDDLTLPTVYAEKVMDALQTYGFTVNERKSCYHDGPSFRESCGGEYYAGEDITPIRVSRWFVGLDPLGQEIKGLIDMANRYYGKLPLTRRVIINHLKRLPLHKRPLFDDSGEKGIFSPNPTNFHLKSIIRSDGEIILLHGDIVTEELAISDDDLRYYLTLVEMSHRPHVPLRNGYMVETPFNILYDAMRRNRLTLDSVTTTRWGRSSTMSCFVSSTDVSTK